MKIHDHELSQFLGAYKSWNKLFKSVSVHLQCRQPEEQNLQGSWEGEKQHLALWISGGKLDIKGCFVSLKWNTEDFCSESVADNLYLSGGSWLAAVTNIPQGIEIIKL